MTIPRMNYPFCFLVLAMALGVLPGAATATAAPARDSTATTLTVGYSLLHKLYKEEELLQYLLIVKDTPPAIGDYAKRVSRCAEAGLRTLEHFRAQDKDFNFENDHLPTFETQVRASIREVKQHDLLFGFSGPDYVKLLLLSQVEACTYAQHVTKVLAEDEPDADRARELRKQSDQWKALRAEAFHALH